MHNLKNISLDIPRNKLIVFTGLSGSGKSTLAFDTLYAEGQRRYVESLSTYARQFLGQMKKPEVDLLEGLSPAVSIEQKTTSNNPRSTVGTVTEIYDHLRLLFARAGQPHCPECGDPIRSQSVEDMVSNILKRPAGEKVIIMAPLVEQKKGSHEALLQELKKEGFVRARVNKEIIPLNDAIKLDKNKRHTIEVVIDRLVLKPGLKRRLDESISTAVRMGDGMMLVLFPDLGEEQIFSEHAACPGCSISLPELTPQLFSFNNPQGACPDCAGLGVKQFIDEKLIVADTSLSLNDGVIAPWQRRKLASHAENWKTALAAHYQFDLDAPFKKLSKTIQKKILYGSGREKILFSQQRGGRTISSKIVFEGIIPRLTRLLHSTSSNRVREEIGRFMSEQPCPLCAGARLKKESLAVLVDSHSIINLTSLPIKDLIKTIEKIKLSQREKTIAQPIVKEIMDRLSFLEGVGLGYLSLSRRAGTLSGGEAQRIRLASQIGSRLAGVLYILDEPSIGLHQRDNNRLIKTLLSLRDLGNSVIVVEHDSDTIEVADYVVDIGPGAGIHGGKIVYAGDVNGLRKNKESATGGYLSGRLKIEVPAQRRTVTKGKSNYITIEKASLNNLKNINVKIPIGLLSCVTGVSGSGKSSLVMGTLLKEASNFFTGQKKYPKKKSKIKNIELLDKVIDINQKPIGRTPRSNPATYTGVFTVIRELFSRLPEARARGYKAGRFSFNVKGGRCETCQGDGVIRIAMHFLPDIFVPCEKCSGKRYNQETLEVKYKGKNIAEVLAMTIEEALVFFAHIPPIKSRLQTLFDVGLGYISLGQSATTLSGGEAQRIKLAKELSKKGTGKTLYILDEPTTGLHPADIKQLLTVLNRLVDNGNTIVVIEHNLDVIKTADYIIDLGPEGGDKGGNLVVSGTPEQVSACPDSYTGNFLNKILQKEKK